jgi:hypothetical protein
VRERKREGERERERKKERKREIRVVVFEDKSISLCKLRLSLLCKLILVAARVLTDAHHLGTEGQSISSVQMQLEGIEMVLVKHVLLRSRQL